MATFVVRYASSAGTRLSRALSLPVVRRQFVTKTDAGVLHYDSTIFKPFTDTLSACAIAAKSPERLIQSFRKIVTPEAIFEVKWAGVGEDMPDFGSEDFKFYANLFQPKDKDSLPLEEYYNVILTEGEFEADTGLYGHCRLLHTNFTHIKHTIERSESFYNYQVKKLMLALIMAPWWPNIELYGQRLTADVSTNTLENQSLALGFSVVNDSLPRKNFTTFHGVTDMGVIDLKHGNQVLIGEGKNKGDDPQIALAQVIMAMLAQCAMNSCTRKVIWGFTLGPMQYTFVKLEVIGEEVVVTQYPSCLHGRLFHNFIPLMGLGEYIAEMHCCGSAME